MSPRPVNGAELALLQMNVDPRKAGIPDASKKSGKGEDTPVTPKGVQPSKTRTADLGRQQMFPTTSEINKPDDYPLWEFLGSPAKAAAFSSMLWGSMAGLGAFVASKALGFAEHAGDVKKSLPVILASTGVGALAAYLKTNKVRKQNHVYEAWMDTLGDERATLGMLREAESTGMPHDPLSVMDTLV